MTYLEKPPLDELVHYGVKGMKWGVHKAQSSERDTPNKGYSQRKRSSDRAAFGPRGVKRINRRMNAGKTYKQALRREYGRQLTKAAAVSAVSTTLVVLDLYGKHPATYTAKRAETKRGQAAAAAAMGLPRKASSGPSYAKQKRGVYNISSL